MHNGGVWTMPENISTGQCTMGNISPEFEFHAPKLLPWLAKRAGLSQQRATRIWSGVVADAKARFSDQARAERMAFLAEELRGRIAGAICRRRAAGRSNDFSGVHSPLRAMLAYQSAVLDSQLNTWRALTQLTLSGWKAFYRWPGSCRRPCTH